MDEHRTQPGIGVSLEGRVGMLGVELYVGPVDDGSDSCFRRTQQSDFDYINEDGDNGDYAF